MTKVHNTSYLLYVEGVNIMNVIADTGQLSVRRGGSQLLRYGPQWVHEYFSKEEHAKSLVADWENITLGASKGLFFFNAQPASITDIEKLIHSLLAGTANFENSSLYQTHGKALKHLTFVKQILPVARSLQQLGLHPEMAQSNKVDLETLHQGAFSALETLLRNLCAHQQFRQATIALPETPHGAICAWDNLRPATNKVEVVRGNGEQEVAVSDATADRFNFGRRMKTQLLQDILNDNSRPPVVGDINRLASPYYLNQKNKQGKLEGLGFTADKVAVFYADGNQFGRIFAECDSPQKLKQVTEQLATQRQSFLQALCDELQNNPYGHTHTWVSKDGTQQLKKSLRLEILLWGGDEITLVVPAWFGLRTAELFYQYAQADELDLGSGKKRPFSYASSLVFAQSKTSVNRLETVCKDLAELVKQQRKYVAKDASLHHKVNAVSGLAYAVFESVDFPTIPVSEYLATRYGLKQELSQVLLNAAIFQCSGDNTSPLQAITPQVLNTISQQTLATRQLYRLVAAIHQIQLQKTNIEDKNTAYKKALAPLTELLGEHALSQIHEQINALFAPLKAAQSEQTAAGYHPKNTRPWVHLQELMDYLQAYDAVQSANGSMEA